MRLKESVIQGAKVWLELCSKEQDWRAASLFFAKVFENAPVSKRYLPDIEKRKRFLPHYYNYHYETKYSSGRGGLACVKVLKPGAEEPEIVLASAYALRPEAFTKGDTSKMMQAYPAGAEAMLKRDAWYEKEVVMPMVKVARSLGITLWYGMYQGVAEEYQHTGIAKKYLLESFNVVEEAELKRIATERSDGAKHKLPVFGLTYGILIMSNPKVRKFLLKFSTEIAHLHYNFKPGLKCMDDPDVEGDDRISCIFVVISNLDPKYDYLVPKIREEFNRIKAKL